MKEISSRFVSENKYQKSIEFNNSCVSIEVKKISSKFYRATCAKWNQNSHICHKISKQNLFHVHILIINHFLNEIINDNMSFVVKIVISSMSKIYDFENSKIKKQRLYKLMTSHIIHKNCYKIKDVVYYEKNNVCIKRFFKSQRNITNINDSFNYSQMRRFFENMFRIFHETIFEWFHIMNICCWNTKFISMSKLQIDQIRDLFLQIYFQRFRFRRSFFTNHWKNFNCNNYQCIDDSSKQYCENDEQNQSFSRLQIHWIVWNCMKNIEFISWWNQIVSESIANAFENAQRVLFNFNDCVIENQFQ